MTSPKSWPPNSNRYLNSGVGKGEVERFERQRIGLVLFFEIRIADFVPAGERAYYAGFVVNNAGTFPNVATSIIKENGQWK
jgi:hypothetical protein